MAEPAADRPFITKQQSFFDVSRGNPKPHTLKGDDLVKARLTQESWRLEIVADPSATVDKQYKLEDKTAIDFAALEELARKHSVRFLKAMQCLNLPRPLGQGLWEGVPLREVLKLVGKVKNVRRVFWHGFHNNDPKQLFQSSLGYNQIMETPPWDLCPFVAYKLNGEPLSLVRGGPVRIVVPWAHGFKSIKWLHRITLTNDYKTNDTYAEQNNDPDSYLKTAAYLDSGPEAFKANESITIRGTAMVGWSGFKRVEYWVRPAGGDHGKLADDDPAWEKAKWLPCDIDPAPTDWSAHLPKDVNAKDIWGFTAEGKPKEWPMRYSIANWSATIKDLKPGAYEFRARAVDQNGYAQPEPRPYLKSGQNPVQVRTFVVM